jgi:hypothetical protein
MEDKKSIITLTTIDNDDCNEYGCTLVILGGKTIGLIAYLDDSFGFNYHVQHSSGHWSDKFFLNEISAVRYIASMFFASEDEYTIEFDGYSNCENGFIKQSDIK